MDMVTLSLFVVLELAVMLGLVVWLMRRKNRSLHAQLQALTTEDAAPDADEFESIRSGYLPYLEKLILESRQQLESSESGDTADAALAEALKLRLSLLETEKQVTERCNDYPEDRWRHVAELFAPPRDEQAPEAETDAADEDTDEALASALQKIERLETFRDHFFAMKKQLAELEASRQKLADQLETLLPEAERSEELQALLETMNAQRDRLQDELAQLESQSDELAKAAQQSAPSADAARQADAERDELESELAEQIGKQKKKIFELHHLIDDLNLEAEKSEALQTKLDQFDLANRDMNMCLQVLEEENQFLQEQIKSLLQLGEGETVYDTDDSDDADTGELQSHCEALQAQLEEKDAQVKALEGKYAAMEQEYLTLYEETNA